MDIVSSRTTGISREAALVMAQATKGHGRQSPRMCSHSITPAAVWSFLVSTTNPFLIVELNRLLIASYSTTRFGNTAAISSSLPTVAPFQHGLDCIWAWRLY